MPIEPKPGEPVIICCQYFSKCRVKSVRKNCADCSAEIGLAADNLLTAEMYRATLLCLRCTLKRSGQMDEVEFGSLHEGHFNTVEETPGELLAGVLQAVKELEDEDGESN